MSRRNRRKRGLPPLARHAVRPFAREMKALDAEVDAIVAPSFHRLETAPTLSHCTPSVTNVGAILRSRSLWATECPVATGGQHDLEVATRTVLDVLTELELERTGLSSRY